MDHGTLHFTLLDINHSDGSYDAYLPAGEYYVEAWGFDPETPAPYIPQISSDAITINECRQ